MILLKNPTNFSKIFNCRCAVCQTEFSIVVNPLHIGVAVCPNPICKSEKILVEPDNILGDYLSA